MLRMVRCIPRNRIVHRGLLSGFYSNRSLATFILSQCCHNCETEFTVTVKCLNVIVNEKDLNAIIF